MRSLREGQATEDQAGRGDAGGGGRGHATADSSVQTEADNVSGEPQTALRWAKGSDSRQGRWVDMKETTV